VIDALRKKMERATRDTGQVDVESGGLRGEAEVVEHDRVGVVVERIRVRGPKGDVERRAAAIAENVRPGGDRLAPTEVDPRLGGAILRTPPEDMRKGRFYQVEVDDWGAELTRQRVHEGGERAREPFALTHEQYGDVIEGMARALTEGESEPG
jgi:hypothetical protein